LLPVCFLSDAEIWIDEVLCPAYSALIGDVSLPPLVGTSSVDTTWNGVAAAKIADRDGEIALSVEATAFSANDG
jgi:hypothetical protein